MGAQAPIVDPAPVLLTQGDPAGIGPEITLKAWQRLHAEGPAFAVIGSPRLYDFTARHLGLDVPVTEIQAPHEAVEVFPHALPVLPLSVDVPEPLVPGRAERTHAPGVTSAIRQGVRLVMEDPPAALALVTNPINKAALYEAGFEFPGHTEFLAALASETRGKGGNPVPHPVMMLASPLLRVVPLTIHVPVSKVPGLITEELIVRTARIVAQALQRDFGLAAPRLAVSGLNPHAGEQGTLGREDQDVIGPAIQSLKQEGLQVTGPHSADTLFHEAARRHYDAALCMYHDQALIPIKTLDFDRGVNVTLGLPFVRTSPDHGTAYDIAGQGVARPDNLMAALRLAQEMGWRRGAATPATRP